MILIVTYDLKTSRDYTPFYEALKQQGTWSHYLASTWLISTTKSAIEVADAVHPFMDAHDFLFVAEIGAHYSGYLPAPAWQWINTHWQDSAQAAKFAAPHAGLAALSGPRTIAATGEGLVDRIMREGKKK